MLEQRFYHLRQPRLYGLRSGDDQRPGPPRKLRIEQEERQAREMVAVEMRDQDQVDLVALYSEALQSRQRRGAAIDQEIGCLAGDLKAGVLSAAGAERIAAA